MIISSCKCRLRKETRHAFFSSRPFGVLYIFSLHINQIYAYNLDIKDGVVECVGCVHIVRTIFAPPVFHATINNTSHIFNFHNKAENFSFHIRMERQQQQNMMNRSLK